MSLGPSFCCLFHDSLPLELSVGVPVLAFPQWGDQFTNAKCLVDEFNVGIQMDRGEAGSRIILPGENYQMFARGNK